MNPPDPKAIEAALARAVRPNKTVEENLLCGIDDAPLLAAAVRDQEGALRALREENERLKSRLKMSSSVAGQYRVRSHDAQTEAVDLRDRLKTAVGALEKIEGMPYRSQTEDGESFVDAKTIAHATMGRLREPSGAQERTAEAGYVMFTATMYAEAEHLMMAEILGSVSLELYSSPSDCDPEWGNPVEVKITHKSINPAQPSGREEQKP